MLSKCTNPSCPATFRYLREGKLFRLEDDPRLRNSKPRRSEYFWLCDPCSSRMSLRINNGNVLPVMLSALERSYDGRGEITLIDRRDGLLLCRLGFSRGHGTGAVFFN